MLVEAQRRQQDEATNQGLHNFVYALTSKNTHLHNHINYLQNMVSNWVEEDPEEDLKKSLWKTKP